MRTKEDTELIVTDFVLNQYEYILVTIQRCISVKDLGDGEEDGKEWAPRETGLNPGLGRMRFTKKR